MPHLKTFEQRILWIPPWMIHNANHIRAKEDGVKIGEHQASSASLVSILTALYFSALRPLDRIRESGRSAPFAGRRGQPLRLRIKPDQQ